MANTATPLTYKGRPLRRKDNVIYFGNMSEEYIVLLQILDTKSVKDMDVATRVIVQLERTDPNIKGRDRVLKRSEKTNLYTAIDIGNVWLNRALSTR